MVLHRLMDWPLPLPLHYAFAMLLPRLLLLLFLPLWLLRLLCRWRLPARLRENQLHTHHFGRVPCWQLPKQPPSGTADTRHLQTRQKQHADHFSF